MTKTTKHLIADFIGVCFLALLLVLLANIALHGQIPTSAIHQISDKDQLSLARIELDLVKAGRTIQAKNQLCAESLSKNDVEYQAAQKAQTEAAVRLNATMTSIREAAKCQTCYLDEETKDGEKRYVLKKPPEVQAKAPEAKKEKP